MNEKIRMPLTRQDLIKYANNANKEMEKIKLIPRQDRQYFRSIFCEIDMSGNIFWSSMMFGGKLRV